jgi:hypothetical protein
MATSTAASHGTNRDPAGLGPGFESVLESGWSIPGTEREGRGHGIRKDAAGDPASEYVKALE